MWWKMGWEIGRRTRGEQEEKVERSGFVGGGGDLMGEKGGEKDGLEMKGDARGKVVS